MLVLMKKMLPTKNGEYNLSLFPKVFVSEIKCPEIKDLSPYLNQVDVYLNEIIESTLILGGLPPLNVTSEYMLLDEPYKLETLKLLEVEIVPVHVESESEACTLCKENPHNDYT